MTRVLTLSETLVKPRSYIFLCILALILSGNASCKKEPTFKGKPLEAWIEDLNYHNSKTQREDAATAIRQIGTNSLPYLFSEIVRCGNLSVEQMSDPKKANHWSDVMDAFKVLGPIARPVIPALIEKVNYDDRTACAAVTALFEIGSEGVRPLLTALTNASLPVRICIANKMTTLGTNGVTAVPGLLQCLQFGSPKHDESLILRDLAAKALGSIRANPEAVVPLLVKALKDDDNIVRYSAAKSLMEYGKSAQSAIPALEEATKDPDYHVSGIAESALKAIQH
jgi:HEAT repeats